MKGMLEPENQLVRRNSHQRPWINLKVSGQDANMIHRQPALAAQQFRAQGAVAAQNPREVGGGQVMLFH